MARRDVPKKPRRISPNFIHFRASIQLSEALDSMASEQRVTRSELARAILETTLQSGSLAEIGARQGLFHFTAALKRAVANSTPEVAKIIEKFLNKELEDLEATGISPVHEELIGKTRKRVEQRVQQQHQNRARLIDPGPMPLEDGEEDEPGPAQLGPGFGPEYG